jgi:LPS export ABC transporter protein LptC
MQRLLLFLAFMAFGSGMVYLLTVREPPRRAPIPTELPSNVLAMSGVTIRQHEASGLRYELLAHQAIFDERSQETDLTQVEFRIFEANGGGSAQVVVVSATADRAYVEKKGGAITLAGNVRMLTREEAELRSELVSYEQDRKRVVVPAEVWVKAGGAFHRGRSLVYDLQSERMTFTAPIFYQ